MVKPFLMVFWLSKHYSAGDSERQKRCGRQKKRWKDNVKEWTGTDFASSSRAAGDGTMCKGIVGKSFVAPSESESP